MKRKEEASFIGIFLAILATLAAKGFGFIREVMLAKVFGTSSEGDALIIALNIPTVLASGFALALSTIYIPTYHSIMNKEKNSKQIINSINSNLTAILTVIGMIIILTVYLFPDIIIKLFASGFNNETANDCVIFIRLTILSTLPILYGGLLKAYGQITNRYGLITFLGVIVNLCMIFAMMVFKTKIAPIVSISFTTGYYLYMIVTLILILKKDKFRFGKFLSWNNEYLKIMGLAFIPAFLSNIVTEINQMVDKNFASTLSSGTISALNYSSKLVNMITAVLGTAIASVLFVKLSQLASKKEFKNLSNEIIMINSILVSIVSPIFWIIFMLAPLIIQIIYGHGNFNSDSVALTTECLQFYSFGIIGFNLKALWIRCYNASLDTKTPAINSSIAVAINIALNFLFIRFIFHKGLALATVLTSIITDLLLIIQYKRINSYFNYIKCLKEILKPFVASFIYFIALFFLNRIHFDNMLFSLFIYCFAVIAATFIFYFELVAIKSDCGMFYKRKLIQLRLMLKDRLYHD